MEKAQDFAPFDSIIPVKYLFPEEIDTDEINFYIKNLLHVRKPIIRKDDLYKQLTWHYAGATTVSILNDKGEVIYNHDIKSIDQDEYNKIVKLCVVKK